MTVSAAGASNARASPPWHTRLPPAPLSRRYDAPRERHERGAAPFTCSGMHACEVGALTIAFECAGTGPVVALAHGFVGDARSTWGARIEALCDEFHRDRLGRTRGWQVDRAPEDFGMNGYADCFAGFLRGLHVEHAHLVGLSFGAAWVLAAFQRHRGLASSLTLVGGYAGWLGSLGRDEADRRLARSLEASRLTPDEFVVAMARACDLSSRAVGRRRTRGSVRRQRPCVPSERIPGDGTRHLRGPEPRSG